MHVAATAVDAAAVPVHDCVTTSANRPLAGATIPVQSSGVHTTERATTPAVHVGCEPLSE